MCFVGRVNSTAHVDAVGYSFKGLKFNTADLYPEGGTVSAPVKNASTVPKDTAYSEVVSACQ